MGEKQHPREILLRELDDIIRLDRQKDHPIALNVIADLAYVATDEVGAEGFWIAYWCRKFIPDLSLDQVAELVEDAGPRRWYGDDIAKAFDITAADRDRFAACHVGACDDDDHSQRDATRGRGMPPTIATTAQGTALVGNAGVPPIRLARRTVSVKTANIRKRSEPRKAPAGPPAVRRPKASRHGKRLVSEQTHMAKVYGEGPRSKWREKCVSRNRVMSTRC